MAMLDDNLKRLPGMKPARRRCLACSLANAALIIGQTLALAGVLASLWHGSALEGQIAGICAFAACWGGRAVFAHARDRFLDRYSQDTAADLRRRALESLYDAGPFDVAQRGSASILTTLLEGINQIRAYLALVLPKTADLMVYTVAFAAALLTLDPLSGIIAVVIVPCTVFFMRLLGGYVRENAGRQIRAYRSLANRFADSLQGISVLKAFGAERRQAQTVYDSSEELRRRTVDTLKTAMLNSLVLDLFRVFALAAIAIMLGFRLMQGQMQLEPALAVLMLTPELFGALRRWADNFHANLDGKNQLAAVLDIIENAPAPAAERYPSAHGQAPTLTFDGVRYRYPASEAQESHRSDEVRQGASADEHGSTAQEAARQSHAQESRSSRETNLADPGPAERSATLAPHMVDAERDALHGISFAIEGPCRVGLVGASGSGKTTLARLIAGFADPAAGVVAVDGVSGSTLACESWRARTAYLPQRPHIFNDTLRANIAFYRPDAADADVRAAATAAGLNDLVAELPCGLDTVLGEGGRGLSGGQAQRVALARVFLDAGRDVVVFDEPTAHLDIETELALKEDMLRLMDGRLVFFATHRLHWMCSMDRLIVLDGGRIVQAGTYDALAAVPGAFRTLVADLQGGLR